MAALFISRSLTKEGEVMHLSQLALLLYFLIDGVEEETDKDADKDTAAVVLPPFTISTQVASA